MIAAEHASAPGFTQPTAPEAPQFDFATLPHDQLDAFVGMSPEMNVNMQDAVSDAHGRLGLRSADHEPVSFRVGQTVHLTFETGMRTTQTYYVSHDGEMRGFDPQADILPIEVTTFRQGLAEREAARLREAGVTKLAIFSEDAHDIGAKVISNEAYVRPPRFAKLRKLGSAVMEVVADTFARPAKGRHRGNPGNAHSASSDYTGSHRGYARHRA